ncbi:hypothetical protein D3C85_1012810 [compost metagenome]
MSNTFEQGWAARPFKEQFPELPTEQAEKLDRLNMAITDMLMADLLTDAQVATIRAKRFPRLVAEHLMVVRAASAKAKAKGE